MNIDKIIDQLKNSSKTNKQLTIVSYILFGISLLELFIGLFVSIIIFNSSEISLTIVLSCFIIMAMLAFLTKVMAIIIKHDGERIKIMVDYQLAKQV